MCLHSNFYTNCWQCMIFSIHPRLWCIKFLISNTIFSSHGFLDLKGQNFKFEKVVFFTKKMQKIKTSFKIYTCEPWSHLLDQILNLCCEPSDKATLPCIDLALVQFMNWTIVWFWVELNTEITHCIDIVDWAFSLEQICSQNPLVSSSER